MKLTEAVTPTGHPQSTYSNYGVDGVYVKVDLQQSALGLWIGSVILEFGAFR